MIKTEQTDHSNSNLREGSVSTDAFQRLHDEIDSVRNSDRSVGAEMNKIRIVCDAPPVTPRCHAVDEPPNPASVNASMRELNSARKNLQDELDALKPGAPAAGKKFEQDFAEINQQNQSLSLEIDKLGKLTGLSSTHYDRPAITKETEKIDKIAREMEKTRKKMERDFSY